MSQTKAGAAKAMDTIREKYGVDFHKKIARKGGSVHRPESRYFSLHRDVASSAGRRGGLISRRSKSPKRYKSKVDAREEWLVANDEPFAKGFNEPKKRWWNFRLKI